MGDNQGCSGLGTLRKGNKGCAPSPWSEALGASKPLVEVSWVTDSR